MFPPSLSTEKKRPQEARPEAVRAVRKPYIFFSEHFLAVSSHVPPALSQLALSVAFVTSSAKAGPVKAIRRYELSVSHRFGLRSGRGTLELLASSAWRDAASSRGGGGPVSLLARALSTGSGRGSALSGTGGSNPPRSQHGATFLRQLAHRQ